MYKQCSLSFLEIHVKFCFYLYIYAFILSSPKFLPKNFSPILRELKIFFPLSQFLLLICRRRIMCTLVYENGPLIAFGDK